MDNNNYQLSNGNKIKDKTLYPSQEDALNKLYDWYKSDELEATLVGAAGTGKTFIMRYFIQHIVDKTFTITAPTHKALHVLENTVGRRGNTIQKLHGLRPDVDLLTFDIERPQFNQKGEPRIKNFSLIIIDECSMINKDLFILNRQACQKYKTKILYVGDALQLPPVNEDISPTFKYVKTQIKLTQIVRQEEGNPLLELFPLLRNDIVNNGQTFLNHIIKNRKHIVDNVGYEVQSETKFRASLKEGFNKEEFKEDVDFLRCTAYTNSQVGYWNTFIRNNYIYGDSKGKKELIHINDLFTSYNTIVDRFSTPVITNSSDYSVHDLKPFIDESDLETFAVQLKDINDGHETPVFLIVDCTKPSFDKYKNILNLLHNKAVRGEIKWPMYYKYKNTFLTTVDFRLRDSKKKVSKDIDYGYALTTHKLQGSTFENMAIDLYNIVFGETVSGQRYERDPLIRNKLIYVALSRAKNLAILKY